MSVTQGLSFNRALSKILLTVVTFDGSESSESKSSNNSLLFTMEVEASRIRTSAAAILATNGFTIWLPTGVSTWLFCDNEVNVDIPPYPTLSVLARSTGRLEGEACFSSRCRFIHSLYMTRPSYFLNLHIIDKY
uniref:Uncharacterized protein n=1 Tax=Megaselia scalaris TaxID=36166 RepID=T1H592_MEGSC